MKENAFCERHLRYSLVRDNAFRRQDMKVLLIVMVMVMVFLYRIFYLHI